MLIQIVYWLVLRHLTITTFMATIVIYPFDTFLMSVGYNNQLLQARPKSGFNIIFSSGLRAYKLRSLD